MISGPEKELEAMLTEEFMSNSSSIAIQVSGLGDYEYSLDGIVYQPEGYFAKLQMGEYTIYVKYNKDCSVVTKAIYLLNYSKFFTSNGDDDNAYW
jgi:hypothetical protein